MIHHDAGFWVWAEALKLLRNAEHLRDRYFVLDIVHALPCWEPAVDMYAQGDELHLLVALPGVRAEQLEVSLIGDSLMVCGRRSMPANFQHAAIQRLEIPYGRFERQVALPRSDYRLRRQIFEDGCLALVLAPD